MKIVIDTSILIDYLRGGNAWQEFLVNAPRNAELYLPTVGIFEIFSGKSTQNPEIRTSINTLLKKLQHIDLNPDIARVAGELYRESSKQIGPIDYIIAASALVLHATVVTINRKHFELIPNLKLFPL